jgi:hypothetical protein
MTDYTLGPVLMPVGDLVFQTTDKRTFVYAPQDDITPIEVAHIVHLMTFAVTSRFGVGWEPFVDQHNLWRHLKEKNT